MPSSVKIFKSIALVLALGVAVHLSPALASSGPAGELPPAPHGFVWVDFKEGKTSFLKPTDWYEKRETRNGIAALFLSKESIEAKGTFETGLTLNYVSQAHKVVDASPSQFAEKFRALTAAKHPLSASFESSIGPGITGYGFRFQDGAAPPKVIHYFIVADDPADTLRIIFFEAPASEWDRMWPIGQQMLNARMWR